MSFRNEGAKRRASSGNSDKASKASKPGGARPANGGDKKKAGAAKGKAAGPSAARSKNAKAGGKPKAPKRKAPKKASRASKKKEQRKSGLARLNDGLLFVLSNPLRVRMLASLRVEGEASASDLARRLGCSKWNADHHMKVLKKYDCVEFVRSEPVRALEKKIYRAKVGIEFPTEIWEALPTPIQGMVLNSVFMTSFNDVEVALVSRAYEDRPESHASWSNLELDEEGWRQVLKLVDGALVAAKKIEKAAKGRMGDRDPDLTVSLNMSSFVLPEDAASIEETMRTRATKNRDNGKKLLRHKPESKGQTRKPSPRKKHPSSG